MAIHKLACIEPGAQIDESVEIGPFAVIGPNVKIAAGCSIAAHATVSGHTEMGPDNRVFAHAVIGGEPQDKKYKGEPTRLTIGRGNTFRECVTVNTGTIQDGGITTVGDNNWIMAYVHIAHDCHVGSNTIMANGTQLAGHVHVGDFAILGGLTGVHQFVKIGAHSMTGAGTVLLQDLPPYVMSQGYPASPHGLNSEGLKRRGFSPEAISLLKKAYRLLYRDGLTFETAKGEIAKLFDGAAEEPASRLRVFSDFLDAVSRGVIR
jgi:UDP-N-acetylglucosamine acyltransferase